MEPEFLLKLKVNPRSSRDRVAGWVGDRLKVCVVAPPEKGKANDAVLELLSEVLSVPRSRLRLVSGAGGSEKILGVRTADEGRILPKLPPRKGPGNVSS